MRNTNEIKALEFVKANLFRKDYWIKKLALIFLCIVHDFTKYKECRSLADLFYWPDGICLDMAVIAVFIVIGLWSLWDDISIYVDSTEDIFDEIYAKIFAGVCYEELDDEEGDMTWE